MLKNRDTTLKYNVPGETKGTYGSKYTDIMTEGRVFDFKEIKLLKLEDFGL